MHIVGGDPIGMSGANQLQTLSSGESRLEDGIGMKGSETKLSTYE